MRSAAGSCSRSKNASGGWNAAATNEPPVGRLIQFHPSAVERDAIGNEMAAIHCAAMRAGIDAQVYATDSGAIGGIPVRALKRLEIRSSDTLLLHYSLGHPSFEELVECGCRRLMIYHGVTPPHLLAGAPREIVEAARDGLARAGSVARKTHRVAAHSHSSAAELRAQGGPDADVIPYLLREDLLNAAPDAAIVEQSHLGCSTLLVAGRVLPHKRIEDALLVYDYLRRISPYEWRLAVAGSTDQAPGYVEGLIGLCRKLGLPRVLFTGAVSQAAMNAWFRVARALLTVSEHEGFCVPVVEAMHHRVPVFALAAAAVPETMQGAGVVFDTADWPTIAEAIDAADRDSALRGRIIDGQTGAMRRYLPETVSGAWMKWLGYGGAERNAIPA